MHSRKPEISVIIPTLNEEEYIGWTLKSFRRQTFKNFEIIVSDYRSTDRTAKIAESLGGRVVQADKRGIAAGRNFGAKAARADIIVFCDADVVVHKNLLADIKKLLDGRPDIVGGMCVYDTRYEGTGFDRVVYRLVNFYIHVMINLGFPHDTSFLTYFRKDVFKKLGGYDESRKLCEGHDLALRSRKYGKYGFLKTPVFPSVRRYKKAGYWNTYRAYIVGTFYFYTTRRVPMEKVEYRAICEL